MTNTALITGASSGIGAALARYHAAKGGDLIIVARREKALQNLKAELEAKYRINVELIAMDVGNAEQAEKLYGEVKARGLEVDVLINNAGFGGQGGFLDRELAQDQAMINLNVTALVTLSHLIGNDMKARGHGKMLQVSSTASFVPGPYQATYYATKSFVTSFSQAIDHELRQFGVTSTALCPGLVQTEFVAKANLEGTNITKQKGATPESVAKHGYDAMLRGELVTINEKRTAFMLNWVRPFLSRRRVLNMIENLQSKAA